MVDPSPQVPLVRQSPPGHLLHRRLGLVAAAAWPDCGTCWFMGFKFPGQSPTGLSCGQEAVSTTPALASSWCSVLELAPISHRDHTTGAATS